MLKTNTIYNFKDVMEELHIPYSQWRRRKEDLKEWLSNFYDYDIQEGRPITFIIYKIYGEYKPLPRKAYNKAKATREEKQKDYEDFIRKSIPKDSWKITSKVEESRQAIEDFAYEKYGHESPQSVATCYIGPAMESTCIKSEKTIWVNYKNYKPLTEEQLKDWKSILSKNKIGEKEAANAFYRQSEGEDISKEIGFYKKSLRDFKAKYQFSPILVYEWRQS